MAWLNAAMVPIVIKVFNVIRLVILSERPKKRPEPTSALILILMLAGCLFRCECLRKRSLTYSVLHYQTLPDVRYSQ